MLKRYLKLQLFLVLVLFSRPLIAEEEQFMNFDDFLFDVKDYINKPIKVQVPVYAVDIPSRLAQIDGNVAVDLKQIDRQKIKDIITLCDGVGGSCSQIVFAQRCAAFFASALAGLVLVKPAGAQTAGHTHVVPDIPCRATQAFVAVFTTDVLGFCCA